MSGEEKKNPRQQGFTWAQAIRDIVVTAINRGQLPALGMIGIAALILYRMPEEGLVALTKEIMESLRKGEFWAYLLLLAVLLGWYLHTRAMRRDFSEEAERIGREKSKIQSEAAGVPFKTSNRSSGRKQGRGVT